jgi:Na+/H+ antiporter NhaC
MSEHDRDHPHHHGHGPQKTGLRKHAPWMFTVAMILMLIAMVAYTLSLNESLPPGAKKVQQAVPAAP